ncbi:MAG TPA: sigma-54 dependent transcriptional regulator [Myxococcota bacterium]|jgi:DNA-binding NtrC family response regulator
MSEPGDAELSRELIGESRVMRRLRQEIRAVAPLRATVLLTGETGTGKGAAARALHRRSRQAGAPFVHVDCAALSPTLIESELFGHERGAFTGALDRRVGRFELAAEGSVFLDEIGELDERQQAKLLRVLHDREYERIGGVATLPMTARVIAATSRGLLREVREGRFRADLYFRLNVVQLRLPPLRERRGDVALLARALLPRLAASLGVAPCELDGALLARLAARSWPGNVRELMNVLERLLIRGAGRRVGLADLEGIFDVEPWPPPDPESALALGFADRDAGARPAPAPERIAAALRSNGGNVARAARELGMPRTTLRHRLRRLGLAAGPSGG